jgi:tRNA-(ms[2]io[6]A)-hydroxylase
MIELKYRTPAEWVEGVVDAIDLFLPDHAAAEKKASSMAMTMVSHYPDRPELVAAMVDLAIEKDPYVNGLRKSIRTGKDLFFMDRLLVAGIIEARGAERFGLVADALPDGRLKRFYRFITQSEEGHEALFIDLAELYFDPEKTRPRLDELLIAEAEIISGLPFRPALH